MRIKSKRNNLVVVLGVFVAVFVFAFLTAKYKGSEDADAADLSKFDPGYIISDYQMGNYNSMSEADIQAFLTAKNPCSTTSYPGLSGATWHYENGHFVCLSEERFGNNDGEIGFQYSESAAHIIWQAAQDYKINPQVLIVLLQKETGMITDPIPNNYDYRKATGYGCPDTAACSSKYYGFKNQIRNAAALFRTVLDGGWTNYPLGENYVQYNPNSGCGGSVVNIRSLATSALYRYTPYQPNAAALAAGYGTGDGCSAYGNRNFYNYFEDWFGGVTVEKYVEPVAEARTKFERPVENGVYMLVSKAFPDKAIDVKGGVWSGMDSALLQMYPKKIATNQVFEIKYNEATGYYNIINPTSGFAFDVKGAKVADASSVQVFPAHNGCNQEWLFEKDNDGYYSIISRCSSKALDASLSTMFVNIFTNRSGDNQKWKLERVDEI
jgi:hypothetical protein